MMLDPLQYTIQTIKMVSGKSLSLNMTTKTHVFPVTIYYEDTDITGLVYHPNYFKYCERARSDFFGGERLRQAQIEDKISVVVYRADIIFRKGATLGDTLEIHTQVELQGEYRVVFHHRIIHAVTKVLMVEANVELVCIFQEKISRIPYWIAEKAQEA